jgi:hypothetical protein
MAAAIRRRSWAFPLLGSILLLVFAFLALRPGHRWMDNSGARVPKSRFSMPGLRRVAPLQPRQSGHQNLVFDPVLVYSTFLGGAALGGGSLTGPSQAPLQLFAQGVAAITVDRSGNLLVGGATTAADFPVTTGVVQPNNPQNNSVGFLSKINPAGHLVFSTYLDGMATVASIAVDASGNIYVAGISNPSGVPQAPLAIPSGTSPFDPTPKPISIVKLNSAASKILNATYLGGSAVDAVSGLTLDANGNVYSRALGFSW